MKAKKENDSEEEADSSDDNFYGDEDDDQNQKQQSAEVKKEGKCFKEHQIAVSIIKIFQNFMICRLFDSLIFINHIEKP